MSKNWLRVLGMTQMRWKGSGEVVNGEYKTVLLQRKEKWEKWHGNNHAIN